MPPRKNARGRWESQFTTPPNALGQKVRGYVVCRPGANSRAACAELERQAIDRHVRGVGSSSLAFAAFVEKRFLPDYPAAKNLSPSWAKNLRHILVDLVGPRIGATPLGSVDAGVVARLCRALREETRLDGAAARAATEAAHPRRLSAATVAGALRVLDIALSWGAAHATPPETRFEAFALRYLARCQRELSAGTVARVYGYHLRRHLIPILADVPVGAIDDTRVARLRTELEAVRRPSPFVEGATTRTGRPKRRWEIARERRRTGAASPGPGRRLGDQTIRTVVMAVKTVLGWAVSENELPRLPEIPLPRVATAKRPAPYSPEEARTLLAAAEGAEWRMFLLLAFDLGCRKSEAIGLHWEQIDYAHHKIRFDRQIYRGDLRACKSGRERDVPMSAPIEAGLRKIRHLAGPLVFCQPDGSPWTDSMVRTQFERTVERAGLRKVRWHDHRHCYSTRATDQGTSVFELRERLGHASVTTTQGYVHPSAPLARSVLDGEAGR